MPGNRLRTDKNSLALLRFSDLETIRVGPRSLIRNREQRRAEARASISSRECSTFFHRDKPDEFEVRTPQMAAIIRGTEFTLEVAEDGTSTLSLLDGEVGISNRSANSTSRAANKRFVEPGRRRGVRPLSRR